MQTYIENLCRSAAAAAPALAGASESTKNAALAAIADAIEANAAEIIAANDADMAAAGENGVAQVMLDRLKLNENRLAGIADAVREVIALRDPVGSGERWIRPNGLEISRVRVPLGVIGMICESRPNVTVDAAAMCVKSGNALVLRSGKEAINSNIAIMKSIRTALALSGLPADAVCLVERTEREGAVALMGMRGYLDALIPRGSAELINSVTENSKIPVIETGTGNCHVYIHADADLDMAVNIAVNAKTSRPSVCNSAETLLVHADVFREFLPKFRAESDKFGVELRGDAAACAILPGISQASEADYRTEYLDFILAVKVVGTIDEAIAHINEYGTHHSDAIVTRSIEAAEKFKRGVDSAAVYVNASTRFTDGGVFGFGAEIGISTQKLHVRGPVGLAALTSEKYVISGNGQCR